jgi:hypothetical protein
MCKYFMVAGVIADVYSVLGLYLSTVNVKPTDAGVLIPILDILAPQGFFFSATGAAFASRGNASLGTSDGSSGRKRARCCQCIIGVTVTEPPQKMRGPSSRTRIG